MSIFLSIVAILISAGSLWFAIWSFRKSHDIEQRFLKIEEDRRAEEKAASLIAYFHGDGNRKTFRIENKGKGQARNIRILLDGQPIEQHPCWVKNQPNRITTLAGYGHGDYIIALSSSTPFPKTADLYWDDDIKKDNSVNTSITV